MAKHWRDQMRHNPGAKSSEEERRVEGSEGWEQLDPGEKGVRLGGTLRMGERAANPSARARPGGKPTAQVGMRVAGGAQFEIAGRDAKPVGDAPASSLQPAGQLPDYLQKHVDEVQSGAHEKAAEEKASKMKQRAEEARAAVQQSPVSAPPTPEPAPEPAAAKAAVESQPVEPQPVAPEPAEQSAQGVFSKIGSWFGGKK